MYKKTSYANLILSVVLNSGSKDQNHMKILIYQVCIPVYT